MLKPINIWSGALPEDGVYSLGAKLTNQTGFAYRKGNIPQVYPIKYRNRKYADAASALRRHTKDLPDLSQKQEVLTEILTAKLTQYPELVDEIDAAGGSDWLRKCSHMAWAKSENLQIWEGTGENSLFIRCLVKAYNIVHFEHIQAAL